MSLNFDKLRKEMNKSMDKMHKEDKKEEEPFEYDHPDIELTEDQKKALNEIIDWLENSNDTYKNLKGYAGTGKTTLLDAVGQYVKNRIGYSFIVTAPTNKAVKVLKEKVKAPEFSTIHSLLNIKPKKKGTKEIFEPVNYDKSDIQLYELVIIDECSMISEKLLDIIATQISDNQKILFSGDPAQLQPINEEKSKCFSYSSAELVEIIRYGDGIAKKAKLVRDTSSFISTDELINGEEIILADKSVLNQFKDWRDNPDSIRMLCWTNAQVEYWNKYLRKIDWQEKDMPEYREGDILIANSPCELGEEIIMMNSEEGIVQSVTERSDAFELQIKRMSDSRIVPIRIVRDKYKAELKESLNSLAQQARTDKSKWREYWSLRKSYHDVRHAYAITTHKAQGSTYNKVVIDVKDINKNRDILNRNQLLYVAMTRAAEKVYILVR